jgi:hypothetical protein
VTARTLPTRTTTLQITIQRIWPFKLRPKTGPFHGLKTLNVKGVNDMANSEVQPISKGLTYVSKTDDRKEVVPFLVEMNGNVRFAPVGSSREFTLDAAEFRNQFELKAIPAPKK